MVKRRFAYIALLFAVTCSAAAAQGAFYLRNNDRVVFYGDSITDQRLYTTFVETFAVTRFPKMKVTFVHSGWGGDRVTGGGGGPIDVRLDRDVLAYKPTVVTIMLGMNDASYRPFDQGIFDTFRTGFEHIVRRLRSALPHVRITLIQPSPFDDVTRPPTFEGGYNAVLRRYGEFVKELAERERLDVADLNTPVVAALQRAHQTDPTTAQRLIQDRVHPGPGGHLLMALALLKAWKAPALVSSVDIKAGSPLLLHADNARVIGITQAGDGIAWTQIDRALPMPIDMNDPITALAVRSSDVVESLNQQPLKVRGLVSPRYTLRIDGEEVGVFPREQLESGINLATLQTPMMKQAARVHQLTLRHNNVHFTRWRTVQVPFQNDGSPSLDRALAGLDALEAEFVRRQRKEAEPLPHRFELTPASP